MFERNALLKEIKSLSNEVGAMDNEFWDFDVYQFAKRISDPAASETATRIEAAHKIIKTEIEKLGYGNVNVALGGYQDNRSLLKPGLNLDLKKYDDPRINLAPGLTFFLNNDLSIGLNLDLNFKEPSIVIIISILAFDDIVVKKSESLQFEMLNILAHEMSHRRHYLATLKWFKNWLSSLTTDQKKLLTDKIHAEQSRLEKISTDITISPEKDAKNNVLCAACISWLNSLLSSGKINTVVHAVVTDILRKVSSKVNTSTPASEVLSSFHGFSAGFKKMASLGLKDIAYQNLLGSLTYYPIVEDLWQAPTVTSYVKDWYGVLLRDLYFTRLNEIGRQKFDSVVDWYFNSKSTAPLSTGATQFKQLLQGLRKQIRTAKQDAGWKAVDTLVGLKDMNNVIRIFEDPSPILLMTYPRINSNGIKSQINSIIEYKDAGFFESNPRYGASAYGATEKLLKKIYLRRVDNKYDKSYLFATVHELLHFIANHPPKSRFSNLTISFSPYINEAFTQYLTSVLLKAQGFNPSIPANSYSENLKVIQFFIDKYKLMKDFCDAYFLQQIKASDLKAKLKALIKKDYNIEIEFDAATMTKFYTTYIKK